MEVNTRAHIVSMSRHSIYDKVKGEIEDEIDRRKRKKKRKKIKDTFKKEIKKTLLMMGLAVFLKKLLGRKKHKE